MGMVLLFKLIFMYRLSISGVNKPTHVGCLPIIILGIFISLVFSCKKEEVRDLPSQVTESENKALMPSQPYLGLRSHSCRWGLCPYKGITLDSSHKYLLLETKGIKHDYFLDSCHLLYPDKLFEDFSDPVEKQ